jgi:hypothetical protein
MRELDRRSSIKTLGAGAAESWDYTASGKSLTMFEDVIKSPKRPALVVVRNPYGK